MTDFNSPENPNSANLQVPLPLKIAVYGMGVALIVMLVLVIMRFMDRRAEQTSGSQMAAEPWIVQANLSNESKVTDAINDGKLLTLVVTVPGEADRVLLVDPRKGVLLGQVKLSADASE